MHAELDPFDTPLPQAAPLSQPTPAAKARKPRAAAPAPAATDATASDQALWPWPGDDNGKQPVASPPFDADPPKTDAAQDDTGDTGKDLTTIKTQLGQYDKIEAGLSDLEQRFKGVVYPVATKEGMKEAQDALKAIRGPRYKLEQARKAAKAPILALGRVIDSRAKEITARLVALETPIDQQVVHQEAIEAERVAKIQRLLAWVRDLPAGMVGQPLAELTHTISELEALDMAEFAEFAEEAAVLVAAALRQVGALADVARQAEAERLRLQREEAERQRIDALRKRVDAIRDNLRLAAMARSVATLDKLLMSVQFIEIGEDFQELRDEARAARVQVLTEIERLTTERQERERQAAALADKDAELERLRAQLAAAVAPPVVEPPEPAVEVIATAMAEAVITGESAVQITANGPGPLELTNVVLRDEPAVDPTSTPTTFGLMPEPPSAEDIVSHLADHYDEHPLNVIHWLSSMDFATLDAAFRQPA